jgi:hypothetical protein
MKIDLGEGRNEKQTKCGLMKGNDVDSNCSN